MKARLSRCRGAVLAKCTEFGYRRWATATRCSLGSGCSDVALAPIHQACTRMMRADYCGDGMPNTVDGHPIDIYDALGVNVEEEPKWKFEADKYPGYIRRVSQETSEDLGGHEHPEEEL